jgi:hypothetical protein
MATTYKCTCPNCQAQLLLSKGEGDTVIVDVITTVEPPKELKPKKGDNDVSDESWNW